MSLCLNQRASCIVAAAAFVALSSIAASAQPVSVTSADPAAGEQAAVGLVVKVKGKNFADGARADFFRSSTSDPAGVTVRSTRFVSDTELEATIDIDAGAALSLFDIRVTNRNGRSGKGSDLFQVVEKAGAAAACALGNNPPNFVQIATLNPGVGGSTYSTELGLGMKATRVTVGTSQAVMVAVGRTGGVEVFFLDPTKVPVVGSTMPDPGFIDSVNPHASVNLTGASWVREMAVGDVDADGTPDILASDRGKAWLLKGSRNVTNQVVFAASGVHAIAVPSTVPVSNFFGWGVALGDLDGGPGDEIVISQTPFQSGRKSHNGKIHLFGWNGTALAFRHTVLPNVTPALAQADGYGRSVTVGNFAGGLNDVVAGAQGRGLHGTLWILADPWNATATSGVATIAPLAVAAPAGGNPLGWKVQAADVNGDGGMDLAATSAWGASSDSGVDVRGETFLGGTIAAGAPFTFQPIPGLHMGWSTMGIDIGNLFGGPEPEVVVGAPNATTSSSCDNVGRLFVFPGRATTATAPWQPYQLRPPSLDVDYGGYGWSAAFVDGLNLLLVAEKGRTVNGIGNAGQIYVYRVD